MIVTNTEKYADDTDITVREFILLGAMLALMILASVGIVAASGMLDLSGFFEALTPDKLLEEFIKLLQRLPC